MELIISFLEYVTETLKHSVFMGENGVLYEMGFVLCYGYLQSYVFVNRKFLKQLTKRSTMGIIAMVIIFLPGIIVKDSLIKVRRILRRVRRQLKKQMRNGGLINAGK